MGGSLPNFVTRKLSGPCTARDSAWRVLYQKVCLHPIPPRVHRTPEPARSSPNSYSAHTRSSGGSQKMAAGRATTDWNRNRPGATHQPVPSAAKPRHVDQLLKHLELSAFNTTNAFSSTGGAFSHGQDAPPGRYSVEKIFIHLSSQQLHPNTCTPPASRMRRSGQERTPIWRPLFFFVCRACSTA